jgi:outer membrane lipoprotein-sorting protein
MAGTTAGHGTVTSLRLFFVQTTTAAGKPPKSQPLTMFLKDGRMRLEQGAMALIFDGKQLLSINTASKSKVAVELPVSQMDLRGSTSPAQTLQKMLAAGGTAKLLGTATLSGRQCDVLELVRPDGTTAKLWIDKNSGVPAKVDAATPKAHVTTVLQAAKVNPPLRDSLFALPQGYRVVKLGSTQPSAK